MSGRDILEEIVARKQTTLSATREQAQREDWWEQARHLPAPPNFRAALARGGRMRAIAEIKRASPSAGLLRADFDPAAIAASYSCHGADAISVLTEEHYFQGGLHHLRLAKTATRIPLLRKDFILDPVQIVEARLAGASAVLLIAECLAPNRLCALTHCAHGLDLEVLVELFDPNHLPAVLDSGARLIGVNNRNLRTFVTDIRHTLDLLPKIPTDRLVVSESGIRAREDVRKLHEAGVAAILVGETLMRAPSPGEKLAELLGLDFYDKQKIPHEAKK